MSPTRWRSPTAKMLALSGLGETTISTVILLHLPERLAADWDSLAADELPGLVLYRRSLLPAAAAQSPLLPPPGRGERLCLRYRDQVRIVDAQTPQLSLGRDPGCMLLIGDHRVSRQHARIEQRGKDYFLVDSSTNGSFVRVEGGREMLLRHGELMLAGSGSICLGASVNDPSAERIDFEHLDTSRRDDGPPVLLAVFFPGPATDLAAPALAGPSPARLPASSRRTPRLLPAAPGRPADLGPCRLGRRDAGCPAAGRRSARAVPG